MEKQTWSSKRPQCLLEGQTLNLLIDKLQWSYHRRELVDTKKLAYHTQNISTSNVRYLGVDVCVVGTPDQGQRTHWIQSIYQMQASKQCLVLHKSLNYEILLPKEACSLIKLMWCTISSVPGDSLQASWSSIQYFNWTNWVGPHYSNWELRIRRSLVLKSS